MRPAGFAPTVRSLVQPTFGGSAAVPAQAKLDNPSPHSLLGFLGSRNDGSSDTFTARSQPMTQRVNTPDVEAGRALLAHDFGAGMTGLTVLLRLQDIERRAGELKRAGRNPDYRQMVDNAFTDEQYIPARNAILRFVINGDMVEQVSSAHQLTGAGLALLREHFEGKSRTEIDATFERVRATYEAEVFAERLARTTGKAEG